MEHDLDTVRGRVEQLHAADLTEDGVTCIVGHVMRHNGREGVALQREYASFEKDFVFV